MTEPAPRLLETPGASTWREIVAAGAAETMRIVGLDGVLADLDRRAAQPVLLPVPAASYGFRWNWKDMADREWWPQGITTSGDATSSGRIAARPVVAVSWYAKPVADAPSRGSRVSFVDLTDPAAPRYTHVLLVESAHEGNAETVAWKPVRVHAGGIAWYGSELFVVDTRRGLRTFALDDIVRVASEHSGHRYVLPQRITYRQPAEQSATPFRFSFVSVDRSGDEHALVVGEYGAEAQTTRLGRYPLDRESSTLLVDAIQSPRGRFAVSQQLTTGVAKMQGAVTIGGTTYLSTSRGRFRHGTLWTRTSSGRLREHRATLAIGPEDLSYWPQRDQIWSVSEYPGRFPRRRFVYAMPRTAFPVR